MTSNTRHLRAPQDVEILVAHVASQNVYMSDTGLKADVIGAVDIAEQIVRETYSRGLQFEDTLPTPVAADTISLDEYLSATQGETGRAEGINIEWAEKQLGRDEIEVLKGMLVALVATFASKQGLKFEGFSAD